jgi:hypothetical protein
MMGFERSLIAFCLCLFLFVISVFSKKWEGLYFALPGMFISGLSMAASLFGGG